MARGYENIYRIARIKAELKREPAAEELGINVRTLDKYESFELRVPDDVVRKMCYLYGDPYLAWRHLKNTELGEFLPDVPKMESRTAVISVANEYLDFEDTYKGIIKIFSDGKVSEDEEMKWEQVKEVLFKFSQSLLALANSDDGK